MDATAFGQPLVVDHLPDDFIPTDAVVVVKGMTEAGPAYFECATNGITTTEALGMVIACSDALRERLKGTGQDD